MRLIITSLLGLVAYRMGLRIVEENSRVRGRRVHPAPSPQVGVDVSART